MDLWVSTVVLADCLVLESKALSCGCVIDLLCLLQFHDCRTHFRSHGTQALCARSRSLWADTAIETSVRVHSRHLCAAAKHLGRQVKTQLRGVKLGAKTLRRCQWLSVYADDPAGLLVDPQLLKKLRRLLALPYLVLPNAKLPVLSAPPVLLQ